MPNNRTGFLQTADHLVITKDTQAQLTYTFDWSEWLPSTDNINTVEYTAAARRNDPSPLTIVTSGVSGNNTYVELSGGAVRKVYIVTAKITTNDGLIDRRSFRVNIEDRSA